MRTFVVLVIFTVLFALFSPKIHAASSMDQDLSQEEFHGRLPAMDDSTATRDSRGRVWISVYGTVAAYLFDSSVSQDLSSIVTLSKESSAPEHRQTNQWICSRQKAQDGVRGILEWMNTDQRTVDGYYYFCKTLAR